VLTTWYPLARLPQSFRLLLTVFIFFNPIPVDDSHRKAAQKRQLEPALHLSLEDQVQWRCAGFVQAEIDKYAEELIEANEELSQRQDDEVGSDDDHDNEARSATDEEENGDQKPKKRASKAKQRKRAGRQGASRPLQPVFRLSPALISARATLQTLPSSARPRFRRAGASTTW
jgi:hypothetical protein